MNPELFESLSKQAAHMLPRDKLNPYNYDAYIKNITELVVRECGNIAFEHWALTHDTSAQEAILKHFGVEA